MMLEKKSEVIKIFMQALRAVVSGSKPITIWTYLCWDRPVCLCSLGYRADRTFSESKQTLARCAL